MGSYKELEVYQMAFDLAIKVHNLTMTLPKYELYEQGSQVRRSAQSIKDNPLDGLIQEYNILGSKINRFIQHVENNSNTTPRNP